jgi:hypothetical protein
MGAGKPASLGTRPGCSLWQLAAVPRTSSSRPRGTVNLADDERLRAAAIACRRDRPQVSLVRRS